MTSLAPTTARSSRSAAISCAAWQCRVSSTCRQRAARTTHLKKLAKTRGGGSKPERRQWDEVCDNREEGKHDDRPQHAAPSASGVHPLPQHHRGGGSGRQSRPCDPRQLRCPQASQGAPMAQSARALHLPLYACILLVAERRGRLLRKAHQAAIEAWRVRVGRRLASRHNRFAVEHKPKRPFRWTADPDKIIAA